MHNKIYAVDVMHNKIYSNLLMISQQTVQNWSFMEKKGKSKGSIACMWTTAASISLKVVMKDAT